MVDFIHLFGPQYDPRLIREAAGMPGQEEVDALLGDLDLPLRGLSEPATTV
jgi:hypothetical protein